MKIFPAIDLYDKKAVRLLKGDYNAMTVYSLNPPEIADKFKAAGAKYMHVVDLEGAKSGETPNFDVVKELVKCGLFVEVGGGIRNLETVEKYLGIDVSRVILGTAAVENRDFLVKAVEKYGDKIAVGVDIKDGFVAIKGWTEKSDLTALDFMKDLEKIGVKTVICTDISKDGAMKGTNHELYAMLKKEVSIDIIASGGVSSIDDVKRLAEKGVYGAIIGKAYYTGAINLEEAIKVAK